MTAAALIRAARRTANLSQNSLGQMAGVAPSSLSLIESGDRIPTVETLERLLGSLGQSLIVIPTRRADSATMADRIRRALREERAEEALREFIQLNDNLAAEHNEVRFALAIAEPPVTGSKHWDAAIAGLVEYRLREESLPLPSWTDAYSRTLKRSWTLSGGRYVVPVLRSRVPEAFLHRNVLVDYETLESY